MLTLVSLLQRNALVAADRPAVLAADGQASTWGEFVQRVARASGVLHALGVRRGDRFALLGKNSHRLFELMHAGYWCGAVPVPLNVRLAAPELAAILDDADVRLVAADGAHAPMFQQAPLRAWSDRLLRIDEAAEEGAAHEDPFRHAAEQLDPCDPSEDDVAVLLYTGGTTGRSKGVPLTHRNIVANALQIATAVGYRGDDVYLHVAPMFHSADLIATGVTLQGGAHAFLPQFTAADFARAVRASGATRTMLAPTMLLSILDDPMADAHALSTMRQLFYGSSPVPRQTIVRAIERLPSVELWQGYGLTETSPLLTLLGMRSHRQALADPSSTILGSAGQPLPGVDIRIVDSDGRAVASGAAGEVWVRGPNVITAYHGGVAGDAFAAGWFRTGDIGRLDQGGFLTLLDRAKDMVITGGENVYSIEVESVLLQHPAVLEAAVIGVPDAKFGESLLAVVACRPGSRLDTDAMVSHCRGLIGGYKIPRRLQLVDALPRTALGKVDKPALRRRFGQPHESIGR